MSHPAMHRCGACGARLFTARMRDTGRLLYVERFPDHHAPGAPLLVVPDLPGVEAGLPHVTQTATRRTNYREHLCPGVRSFTGRGPQRKARL